MRLKTIANSHAKWKKNCIEILTAFHLLAKLHDKNLLVYLSNAWDRQQLIAYTAAAFVTTVKLIFFCCCSISSFFLLFLSLSRSFMPFLQQKTQSEVSKRVFYNFLYYMQSNATMRAMHPEKYLCTFWLRCIFRSKHDWIIWINFLCSLVL